MTAAEPSIILTDTPPKTTIKMLSLESASLPRSTLFFFTILLFFSLLLGHSSTGLYVYLLLSFPLQQLFLSLGSLTHYLTELFSLRLPVMPRTAIQQWLYICHLGNMRADNSVLLGPWCLLRPFGYLGFAPAPPMVFSEKFLLECSWFTMLC